MSSAPGSRLFTRWTHRLITIGVLLLLSGMWPVTARTQGVAARPPQTSTEFIERIAGALEDGRRQTADRLTRLGFGPAVAEAHTLDGGRLRGLSSETLIEHLYRRAEAGAAGEGDRFLAVLYHDAAKDSAALAVDRDFARLRQYQAATLARPIVFARISNVAALPPLSPAAERAIGLLSESFAGPNFAAARGAILRNFRNPKFGPREFEAVLAESSTARDGLRRMVALGTPPPSPEVALRNTMRETIAHSAALSVNPTARNVIDDLSNQLPERLERLSTVEDSLESRRRQMTEVSRYTANGGGGSRPATTVAASEDYRSYIRRTFEDASPSAPSPSVSSGGGGGGGGGGIGGGGGGGGGRPALRTTRSYARAIRSSAAARGVAIGGSVTSSIGARPIRAVWLPNRINGNYGRLVVEIGGSGGAPAIVAASRVLMADSVQSAASILWGSHGPETSFRSGDLLVLMSMDPGAAITRQAFAAIQAEERELGRRAAAARTPEDLSALRTEVEALERRRQAVPRGIVVHPALAGRELSWSVARVDFWFNQMNLLAREALAINGGVPLPERFRTIPISGAQTWQFFEHGAVVGLGPAASGVRTLTVSSRRPDGTASSPQSHYGVSLFAFADTPPAGSVAAEPGVYRLPALERQVQPLLDWLAVNHHDFMRLNDMSEAFSVLRWLKSGGAEVVGLDPAEGRRTLPTPDRVVIGRGPGLGR